MEVFSPSAPPPDPVERILEVSQQSLDEAGRNRLARAVRVDVGCDAIQCRIRLDAAAREISRLRRGLLGAAEAAAVSRLVPPPSDSETRPDPLAAPPAKRKAYAPAPIGKPSPPRDAAPVERAGEIPLINFFRITNMGTLLDVLA